jgi:predicted nucleic acid-binding protein
VGVEQVSGTSRPLLILDANILVDYAHCDDSIIALISAHVGTIHVAAPVLGEVKEIAEADCARLGITLVEPDVDQLLTAAQGRGRLSMQDHLCLLLAKERGWTCVTNDRPLRRECEAQGVPLIWGIELICKLVEAGGLRSADARDVICCIHRNNPRYISLDVVRSAFARLGIEFESPL